MAPIGRLPTLAPIIGHSADLAVYGALSVPQNENVSP